MTFYCGFTGSNIESFTGSIIDSFTGSNIESFTGSNIESFTGSIIDSFIAGKPKKYVCGKNIVNITDFKKALNKPDAQANEEIFCPARQKFAGIPDVFQKLLTQSGRKIHRRIV